MSALCVLHSLHNRNNGWNHVSSSAYSFAIYTALFSYAIHFIENSKYFCDQANRNYHEVFALLSCFKYLRLFQNIFFLLFFISSLKYYFQQALDILLGYSNVLTLSSFTSDSYCYHLLMVLLHSKA